MRGQRCPSRVRVSARAVPSPSAPPLQDSRTELPGVLRESAFLPDHLPN